MTSCTCHHHTQTEPGSTRCRVDHAKEAEMREDCLRALERDVDVCETALAVGDEDLNAELNRAIAADDGSAMVAAFRKLRRHEAEKTLERRLEHSDIWIVHSQLCGVNARKAA